MSVSLVSQMLRQRIPDRTEKLILIAFAEHADQTGLTWPSVDLVAAEAQCTSRTVQRALPRFLESGVLELCQAARGRGHPAVYRVVPEALGAVPEYWQLREAANKARRGEADPLNERDAGNVQRSLLDDDEPADEKGDATVSPIPGEKGDISARKGDKSAVKGDTAMSPEPGTIKPGAAARSENPAPGRRRRSPATQSRDPARADPSGRLAAATRTAVSNRLPPKQRDESPSQFCNRVDQQLAQLATLGNTCRQLKIEARQPSESIESFNRRVVDADFRESMRARGWQPASEGDQA